MTNPKNKKTINVKNKPRSRKKRLKVTEEKLNILIRMEIASEKVTFIATAINVTVQTIYKHRKTYNQNYGVYGV